MLVARFDGRWLASVLLPMVVLAACGDDSTSTGGNGGGGEAGSGGIAGSGGVGPGPGGGPNGGGGSGAGGSGAGGSGAGGSGAGPAMNEDCETAQPLSLAPGGELTIPFTITEMTGNEVESFCDGNDPDATADLVYEVTTSGTCSFFATTSGMVDSEIIVRSVCDVEQFCFNANPNGGDSLALNLDAGTYFVIVQGDPGDHTLSLECAVPTCGDGVPNEGEECEDGNVANGDGCDSNCELEPPDPTVEDCPAAEAGAAVMLMPGLTYVPSMTPLATTLTAVNNATGSCMFPPGTDVGGGVVSVGSPDHVYRVRVAQAGSLTITLGNGLDGMPFCGTVEPPFPYPAGCWDRSLYVRQADCGNPAAEIACDDDGQFFETESVTFAAAANTDYFVFVDGWTAFSDGSDSYDRGSYTLEFDLN